MIFNNQFSGGKVIHINYTDNLNLENVDLTSLSLLCSANIDLTIDPDLDSPHISLSCEEHLISSISITHSNEDLCMNMKGSCHSNYPIVLTLKLPALSMINVIGSGDVHGSYIGNKLALNLNGSGDIILEGTVEFVSASIIGSGDIDIQNLQSKHGVLEIAGSGDLKAFCTEKAYAQVKGSGDITIYGNPIHTSKKIAGSGDISFKKTKKNHNKIVNDLPIHDRAIITKPTETTTKQLDIIFTGELFNNKPKSKEQISDIISKDNEENIMSEDSFAIKLAKKLRKML